MTRDRALPTPLARRARDRDGRRREASCAAACWPTSAPTSSRSSRPAARPPAPSRRCTTGSASPSRLRNAGKRSVVIDSARRTARERLLGAARRRRHLDRDDPARHAVGAGLDPSCVRARNPRARRAVDHRLRPDRAVPRLGGDRRGAAGDGRRAQPLGPARARAADAARRHGAAVRPRSRRRGRRSSPTGTGWSPDVGDHIDFSLYEATAQAIEPAHGHRRHRAGGRLRANARPAGAGPVSDLPLPRRSRAGRAAGAATMACDARVAGRSARSCGIRSSRRSAAARSPPTGCTRSSSGTSRERGKDELALEGQARGVPIAPVLTPGGCAERPSTSASAARSPAASLRPGSSPTSRPASPRSTAGGCGPRAALREWASTIPSTPPRRGAARATPDGRAARLQRPPAARGPAHARLRRDRVRRRGRPAVLRAGRGGDQGREPRRSRTARASHPCTSRSAIAEARALASNLRSAEGVEVIKRLVPHGPTSCSRTSSRGRSRSWDWAHRRCASSIRGSWSSTAAPSGPSGPWSEWMGYGPLVRCVSGLTSLWRYPDDDEASFSDSTVIHPDHYAARVCAITDAGRADRPATLAAAAPRSASRRRRRSSRSSRPCSRHESLERGSSAPADRTLRGASIRAPGTTSGAWSPCAATPTGGACGRRSATRRGRRTPELATRERAAGAPRGDRRAAGGMDGRAHRPRGRGVLQRAGVPAGFMQRPDEYEHDPHLRARDFLRTFEQPGLAPLRIENTPFRSERIPAPGSRPGSGAGRAHARDLPRASGHGRRRHRPAASRSTRSRSRPRSRRSRRSRRPEGRHERVGYRAILTRVLPNVSPASSRTRAPGACSRPSTIVSR